MLKDVDEIRLDGYAIDEEAKANRGCPDHGYDVEDAVLHRPAVDEQTEREEDSANGHRNESVLRSDCSRFALMVKKEAVEGKGAKDDAEDHTNTCRSLSGHTDRGMRDLGTYLNPGMQDQLRPARSRTGPGRPL